MQNFWQKLKKPFLVQAPMDNVTDVVFRELLARVSKPDVFFTEFTNTDGMLSKGSEHVLKRLKFTPIERPIVAQIWGNTPEHYYKATKMIIEMGFDGVDINMGCPDRSIVARGCCGGLTGNPTLAHEIIAATKDGANGKIPVSVKTRIGYRTIQTQDWVSFLLEQKIAALTLHGRTVKEMSKVPAHWDEIGKAVEIRNQMENSSAEQRVKSAQETRGDTTEQLRGDTNNTSEIERGANFAYKTRGDATGGPPTARKTLEDSAEHRREERSGRTPNHKDHTLIIGNGDVETQQEALDKSKQYGVDGVMIGRGIFHNLWIFNRDVDPTTITPQQKLQVLIEHLTLWDETWGTTKNFDIMKKFYKIYVSDFDNASEYRIELMAHHTAKETIEAVQRMITSLSSQ